MLTEAKLSWDLGEYIGNDNLALRLVGGRYWWPFGIHNDEWFSAVNRFALLSPAATDAVGRQWRVGQAGTPMGVYLDKGSPRLIINRRAAKIEGLDLVPAVELIATTIK